MVPNEKVREIRKSKKIETEQKFFPGYLLVEMELTDDTWHLVRSTPKVTGLRRLRRKPSRCPRQRSRSILRQMEEGAEKPKLKSTFQKGDKVRVIEGPFVNFQGAIDDLNPERGKLKVDGGHLRAASPPSSSSTTRWRGSDMAKKVQAMVKLQITAGKANPSPPVGPALGQHGVNIMEFCKGFNAQTNSQEGLILPVVVTIYQDRSFTFVVKTPPAAVLLKRAAGIAKASAVPHKDKIGKVTRAQVREIAQTKLVDLNTDSIESAMRTIEGTARSMGIEVV